MEKIKILYFVDRLLLGGIQKLIVEWALKIDKSKFQVDFLLLDDGQEYDLEKRLKEEGFHVYKLEGIWIKSLLDYIDYAKALDLFFSNHRDYKVVHMHSSSKNFLVLKYAKKYQVPIRIAHSHNIDFQTKNKLKKCFGDVLKISLRKYATDYFACSTIAGEWLFGKQIVKGPSFKVIHNAIDYGKFKFDPKMREKMRAEFKISGDVLLIGNVGRFMNQKNHTFLIDIFYELTKLNPNVMLILIGIGEKEEEIKNKVAKLHLKDRVIFAGFRENVNELMQAMDVFLLPSLHEGLPVVGIEAQASGLPVFTSKDVVTKELKITNQVHFISLEKNASEWANDILKSDLSRGNTRKYFEKEGFLIEDIVKELSDFYMK